MNRPLEGRVALVTGGGVRLGRALALGLGQLGAHVAIHFHGSEEGARQAARAIEADGNRAVTLKADLTKAGEPQRLVQEAERALGGLDVLVNSAAVFHRKPFLETSEELLELQWGLNARAPFLVTQAAARGMLARGGGQVLNILDIGGGLHAWANYSAYCMSKAAFAMLTRTLALELAPVIRVNGIAPGTVLPPEGLPEQTLQTLRDRIPQRRFGSAEDIVRTAQFLLTGPAFITGQVIAVDGGRSVGLAPGSREGGDVG